MAGDWIKIELELPDKPEVHQIANILGIDPDTVLGKLFRVWAWFDKHTKDGNAHGVTFSLIDRITGVSGFGEAMQFAGWIEQNDVNLSMPKFDRHTSKSAKTRATTGERVKRHRNAECNASTVTKPLPEKRREEKIDISIPPSAPRAKKASGVDQNFKINETGLRYAKDRGVDVETELQSFLNYHQAKGTVAKDWQAGWRMWCDKAVEFGRSKPDGSNGAQRDWI